MIVYFVRHGSTISNEKKLNQPSDTPLSEKGIIQAKELVKRFSKTQIDLVISSPYPRARQTAKEISNRIMESDLLVEFKKPSEVMGKAKNSIESLKIFNEIREKYKTNPNWHYSDEENFEDLKARGLKALELIESQNKENILVVSHENIITPIVALMMFGKEFSVETYLKLRDFVKIDNTGVTICSYENKKWKLICWNDTSHCLE